MSRPERSPSCPAGRGRRPRRARSRRCRKVCVVHTGKRRQVGGVLAENDLRATSWIRVVAVGLADDLCG
jgi:hypothetical protein